MAKQKTPSKTKAEDSPRLFDQGRMLYSALSDDAGPWSGGEVAT